MLLQCCYEFVCFLGLMSVGIEFADCVDDCRVLLLFSVLINADKCCCSFLNWVLMSVVPVLLLIESR